MGRDCLRIIKLINKNMKYRIYYSHCGDAPTSDIREFKSDDEAIKKLDELRNNPHYGFDKLWMERIDIEEKTTRLGDLRI